jgi:hypothetical protein
MSASDPKRTFGANQKGFGFDRSPSHTAIYRDD